VLEQFVSIEGDPHSATISFEVDDLGVGFNGLIRANVRVTPDFDPSNPEESDILTKATCDLEHFATPAGVTGLKARSEVEGESCEVQHSRIVNSIGDLVTTLNDIANGTGEWGPQSLEQ
jgi:hypothetical protein